MILRAITAAAVLATTILIATSSEAKLTMPEQQEPATVSCGHSTPAINPRALPPDVRMMSSAERTEVDRLLEEVRNSDSGAISTGLALERKLQRILALLELSYGPRHPLTGFAYGEMGDLLVEQRRGREAGEAFARARDILWNTLGDTHCETDRASRSLMWSLKEQHRFAEAVDVVENQIAAQERRWGKESQEHQLQWNRNELSDLLNLISPARAEKQKRLLDSVIVSGTLPQGESVLLTAGRLIEAQKFDAAADMLRATWQQMLTSGGDEPFLEPLLQLYTLALSHQGKVAEPDVYERLISASSNPDTPPAQWSNWSIEAKLWSDYGRALLAAGQAQKALSVLQRSCGSLSQLGYDEAAISLIYAGLDPRATGECRSQLARAIWAVARSSPKSARESKLAEAFEAVQPALVSDATRALGRNAAIRTARASGRSSAIERVEHLTLEIEATTKLLEDGLDEAGFAKVGGPEAARMRAMLQQRERSLRVEREQIAQSLVNEISQLRGFLAPEPVSIDSLQRSIKPMLLRPRELLLLPIVGEPNERGLIFAVSREKAVWAELGMTGQEITDAVRSLRANLDPCKPGQSGCKNEIGQAFDFEIAHRLFRALFGDPAIAALLTITDDVILVPTGALTSLPPSVLLTQPYAPDRALDQASQFRAAPWFIKQHSISVLPGVAELQTIRSRRQRPRGIAAFLAFAEPDYSGIGITPRLVSGPQSGIDRSGTVRTGMPDQRSLIASLPPLPGTRIEAERLQSIFSPERSIVKLYDAASERELRFLSESGALGRADVVLFATHGIVRGDNGLREAALALAPAVPGSSEGDDGLLSSAEISTLRVNAELLILSACNTALSPEDWSGVSYSELVRAFFEAGARSIVASHWRVDDATAPGLLEATLQEMHGTQRMSASKALQQASLRILMGKGTPVDGLDPDAAEAIAQRQAHPAFWAPFTLIGAPD